MFVDLAATGMIVTAREGMHLHQVDVSIACLNGVLKEEVYTK